MEIAGGGGGGDPRRKKQRKSKKRANSSKLAGLTPLHNDLFFGTTPINNRSVPIVYPNAPPCGYNGQGTRQLFRETNMPPALLDRINGRLKDDLAAILREHREDRVSCFERKGIRDDTELLPSLTVPRRLRPNPNVRNEPDMRGIGRVQFPYTQPLPSNLCRKALGLTTGIPGFGNRRGLYRA